ncbi:MAG TPA: putative LPS assembly protein LptD, partial [Bacteroidales bacterium]|nr:putative LPS assembly protein LptD [Bacteroidales bacterium]
KIVSGPGNLVLEGIPLPLFIPFGYFPIETKKAASGIIFPRIGQENRRGYSLTDGGYYFAVSDYFDLAIKGNVYSNGTWLLTAMSNYKRLYKYSGNFTFSYANNISGHLGLQDYRKVTNYRLGWTFTQDPKASPGSRFSASVNMSSNGYDRSNSYVVAEHVTTQRQSSISYSKSWDGTPFNFAVSANHSQNVKTGDVSLDLPKMDFNMSRIYPFKSKYSTGKTRWYQELQLSYTAKVDNKINTKDSLLFSSDIFKKMNNGFRQEIPMSIQLRPFNNFSISPSVTYTGVLYTKKIEKLWNEDSNSVEIDTLSGAFYGQAFNPSISAGFSPQIFGTYTFTRPNSRVQAIRHVIKPSVGFSFVPSLAGLSSKMYRQVQTNPDGLMQKYSIFEGSIFGTPSLASKSGNVSFSLVNIVEAKVFGKNDTTGKPHKVKLIDNFGISTSYNIFADSMRWAPVAMQMHTSLFNKINISASSSFTMYSMNDQGRTIGKFYYSDKGKLLRLTNFSTSLDFSLSDLLKGNKSGGRGAGQSAGRGNIDNNNPLDQSDDIAQNDAGSGLYDEYGYPVFDVPWSMNVSYNLSYSKPGLKSNISQTLSVRGNVSLTKKMSITYTSGYDFTGKKITMTQIGITRDLHCWEMNFNWVPNGTMKMWNFTIRVKASVLGDLKYERRKDFHDTY